MGNIFLIQKKYCSNRFGEAIFMLPIIFGLSLLYFFFAGHYGFDLADEGFLWYGSQRVLSGEIPLRDFASYDIGRYYWTAAFMKLSSNKGLIALRAAAMVFQTSALCIMFWVLIRTSPKQNILYWLLAIISLMVWMLPPYRVYDISLPIFLMAAMAWLIQKPSRVRYFLTGFTVGLAAVFGRNHGLYGALASVGAILLVQIKNEEPPSFSAAFLCWSVGVVVGYSPVLIFMAWVPGFTQAFGESIKSLLFEIKTTNHPLPVPWPWLLPVGNVPFFFTIRFILRGSFFAAVLLFGIIGMIWMIRGKIHKHLLPPVSLAAICLALPYAHYAFSRADMLHLAPAMPTFIMGTTSLLYQCSAKWKWSLASLLCVTSLLLMIPLHPRVSCHFSGSCKAMVVSGDRLILDAKTADKVAFIKVISAKLLPPHRTLLFVPFSPGAYAMLGRKSPMWDIYALFPRSILLQQKEIERIKRADPYLVLIDNSCLDGNASICFRKTHPIIYEFINNHFTLLNDSTATLSIYISRQ